VPLRVQSGLDGLNNYVGGPAYAVGPNGTDDGFSLADPPRDDLSKRDLRYAYASNLVAVNSDVYCAYIRVQLGDRVDAQVKRHYIAIIDRSNCIATGDRPIVRAFAEVR